MDVMTFDGSMEEFLSAVFKVYVEKMPALLYREKDYVPNLVDTTHKVIYQESAFDRVRIAMQKKFSSEALHIITHCLMNNDISAPYMTMRYVILCFNNPKSAHDYQNETIIKVTKMARQVSLESHRFLGFVRFHQVGSVYISVIKPDHEILSFIAPHFSDRYSTMDFIIYDEGRQQAIICEKGHWVIRHNMVLDEAMFKKDDFEDAWKTYFEGTTITSRKNLKAQKKSMPKRYWKNLLEIPDHLVPNDK